MAQNPPTRKAGRASEQSGRASATGRIPSGIPTEAPCPGTPSRLAAERRKPPSTSRARREGQGLAAMSELEYLEYEFYDAQAKWKPARCDEQQVIRKYLLGLAHRADLHPDPAGSGAGQDDAAAGKDDRGTPAAGDTGGSGSPGLQTHLRPHQTVLADAERVGPAPHALAARRDEYRGDLEAGFAAELSALRRAITASVPA